MIAYAAAPRCTRCEGDVCIGTNIAARSARIAEAYYGPLRAMKLTFGHPVRVCKAILLVSMED